MAIIKLDYVNSYTDVRGKRRHQFRRKGHKKVMIPGRPGSPEFMEVYHALLEKTGGSMLVSEAGANRTKAGTVDAIAVAYYKSDAFKDGLAEATQKAWRNIINRFREFQTPAGRYYGQNSIRDLPAKSIQAFLKGKTANAQKTSLKAIRSFARFAIAEGELVRDPTEAIEIVKAGPKSTGHMTWLEPQIAQYREHHLLGTIARLAIELLLNIAARRQDAHMIGQQHVRVGSDEATASAVTTDQIPLTAESVVLPNSGPARYPVSISSAVRTDS